MIRQAQHSTEDLTARELAVQLSDQMAQLVRTEIALARAELFVATRQAMLGGAMLIGAAELLALRRQADAAGCEVAGTVAALADRLTAAARPRAWARSRMAEVRARARRATRRAAGMPAPTGRLRLGVTIAALSW